MSLKEIKKEVLEDGYRGYLASDIEKANQMREPNRTHKLRAMKEKACADLRRDTSIYREVALALVRHREAGNDDIEKSSCDDVHVSVSLKHNYIYNDFGHLIALDDLLSKQGDLFGF